MGKIVVRYQMRVKLEKLENNRIRSASMYNLLTIKLSVLLSANAKQAIFFTRFLLIDINVMQYEYNGRQGRYRPFLKEMTA